MCAEALIAAVSSEELAGARARASRRRACARKRFARRPLACACSKMPAMTLGAAVMAPGARSIVQVGAQNAFFVTGVADGRAPQFAMNEGCAAGTGSFFEDQMGRLGLSIEGYSDIVERASTAPRLSGRCAVFAKTDIIHRQQEGVPIEDILLGLCYAMVKSYKATIVRKMPVEAPVLLAGGVVRNAGVVRAVRDVFKLDEGDLIADTAGVYVQAAGAAAHAAKGRSMRADTMLSCPSTLATIAALETGLSRKHCLGLRPCPTGLRCRCGICGQAAASSRGA